MLNRLKKHLHRIGKHCGNPKPPSIWEIILHLGLAFLFAMLARKAVLEFGFAAGSCTA
jgi:hypothetical protein